MKTCDTCSMWSDEAPYRQPDRYKCRRCNSNKLEEEFFDMSGDALHYSYMEGGCFYTDPKFGCIHHVTK